jgi:hypothetical protein
MVLIVRYHFGSRSVVGGADPGLQLYKTILIGGHDLFAFNDRALLALPKIPADCSCVQPY